MPSRDPRNWIDEFCSWTENWVWELICANRDAAISVLIVSTIGVLDIIGIIELIDFSPSLAAAIFTVIITTIGTLFSILSLYSKVIQKAYKNNYYDRLRRTFLAPVSTGVWGFIIATLATVVSVDSTVTEFVSLSTLQDLFTLLMTILLTYSILSFYGAFKFVLTVVLKEEKNAAEREVRENDSPDSADTSDEVPASDSSKSDDRSAEDSETPQS